MMMLMWPARWDDLGCKMSLSRSCQKCVVYSLFVEFKWGPSLSTLVLINIQISCYFFFRDIKHVCCKSTRVQSRTYRGVTPSPSRCRVAGDSHDPPARPHPHRRPCLARQREQTLHTRLQSTIHGQVVDSIMTPFWFGIFWYFSVVMMNIVKGKLEFQNTL